MQTNSDYLITFLNKKPTGFACVCVLAREWQAGTQRKADAVSCVSEVGKLVVLNIGWASEFWPDLLVIVWPKHSARNVAAGCLLNSSAVLGRDATPFEPGCDRRLNDATVMPKFLLRANELDCFAKCFHDAIKTQT